MYSSTNSKRQLIVSAVIVVSILLLATLIWVILSGAGKITVGFVTMPSDSTITVNGRVVSHNTKLAPGKYKVTLSREGFKTATRYIEVENKEGEIFGLSLEADSDIGKKYLEDNPDEITVLENIGAIESRQSADTVTAKLPVINKLPRIDPDNLYAINYGPKDDGTIFILIGNSATQGRKDAINWLKKEGVDITSTDIRYDDYISPLKNRKLSERMY